MFILLRLVINAVALLLAAWIVPGIHLAAAGPHPSRHDWVTLLIVALIFGVMNAVIRPILIILSLPLEAPPLREVPPGEPLPLGGGAPPGAVSGGRDVPWGAVSSGAGAPWMSRR